MMKESIGLAGLLVNFVEGGALDWDQQRSLLAVLREGSLLAAARVLDVSQPTVRRRIEALEAELGMPLFTRAATAWVPTQTTLNLRPHLEAMERAAAAFQRGASADATAATGTVRLAASEMLGVEMLPDVLAGLGVRHASLEIELSLSGRLEDLVDHEADIALRTHRPGQDALVVRRLGTVRVGLYATQALLDRHGCPQTLDALADWPLVTPDRSAKDWLKLAEHGYPTDRVQGTVRTDNHLAQLAAIRAGLGIGACHREVARRSGLVPVLEAAFGFDLEVWLAMPESLRGIRRVVTVFGYLADAMESRLAGMH